MPFVRVGISYSLRSQHDANIRIGTNDANEYESSTFVRHGLYLHPATGGMLACSLYGAPVKTNNGVPSVLPYLPSQADLGFTDIASFS